jgi:hypothetical protein
MASLNQPKIMPLSSPSIGSMKVGISAVSSIETVPGIIENVLTLSASRSSISYDEVQTETSMRGVTIPRNSSNLSNQGATNSPASLIAIFPTREHLSAFAKETGLTGPFITPVLSSAIPYEQALMSVKFFDGICDAFMGITEINTIEKNVYVPIGEIHCPKIKGCEAEYIQNIQNEKNKFIKVTIFGIGGGRHVIVSVGSTYKVTAKTKCLRILQEMKLKYSKKKSKKGKPFTSIEVVKTTNHLFQEKIHNCPTCGENYNFIKDSKDYEDYKSYHIVGDTSIVEKMRINTGADFSISIDLLEMGISGKMRVSTKVIKEITCNYNLVKGHDYIAYTPKPKSSLLYWTWSG